MPTYTDSSKGKKLATKQVNTKSGKQGTNLNCGNKGGKAVVAPKKVKVVVQEDDSFGAGSTEDLSGASVTVSEEGSVEASATEEVVQPKVEMTQEMKASEANIKWDKLEIHFDHEFDLNDYVTENNKGQLKLENNGNLVLSTENGILRKGYRSKAPDFEPKAKDTKSNKKMEQNSDIVKSVHLEHFKMHGWNEKVVMNLTAINKFQEEGHVGESETVNHMIYPSEWQNSKTAKPITIINRTITNSMMNFQKKFPGVNPENLARGITKNGENDDYLVDINSPMVAIINIDKAADTESGEYTPESPNFIKKTKQVLIPKSIVRVYRAKTLEEMSKSISYANITDDRFAISFEVPVPSSLLAKHQDYVATKGTAGRQFLGFADTPFKNKIGSLGASVSDTTKISKNALLKDVNDRFVRIEGKLVIHYKRINQETLEDL